MPRFPQNSAERRANAKRGVRAPILVIPNDHRLNPSRPSDQPAAFQFAAFLSDFGGAVIRCNADGLSTGRWAG